MVPPAARTSTFGLLMLLPPCAGRRARPDGFCKTFDAWFDAPLSGGRLVSSLLVRPSVHGYLRRELAAVHGPGGARDVARGIGRQEGDDRCHFLGIAEAAQGDLTAQFGSPALSGLGV